MITEVCATFFGNASERNRKVLQKGKRYFRTYYATTKLMKVN